MRLASHHEYPKERAQDYRKAVWLEITTIAYLVSVVVPIYLLMGSSQAMKAAWIESMLSMVPPTAFLISSRVARNPPSLKYPYGLHRAASVGYLASALALFAVGAYLAIDSALVLIMREHPTIPTALVFGQSMWMGWPMLAVLVWGGAPAAILGRLKKPLAKRLNDKSLWADADINSADWRTALAAGIGIVGIGFGLWWADAAAALLISFSVLRDGFRNTHNAASQLVDRAPLTVESEDTDLGASVSEAMCRFEWVEKADVRLREQGHLYFGEVFLHTVDHSITLAQIEAARERVSAVDWRLGEITVSLSEIEGEGEAYNQ